MESSLRLPLKRPPFWTARTLLFAAIPAAAYMLLPSEWTAPVGPLDDWLGGAWLPLPLRTPALGAVLGPASLAAPLLAFGAILRHLTRVATVPGIEATDRGLVVPLSAESSRSRLVPYGNIEGVEQMARGRKPVLLVATREGPLVLPLDRIEGQYPVQRLRQEVQARLLHLPNGTSHLAAMAARSRQALALASARPRLTRWLLALLGLIFFYELWVADGSEQLPLLQLGGNARALVQTGQWQRLISANFLHAGALHWIMNGLGLAAVGGVVERLLGWHRLAIIYSVSGVLGAVSSTLWGQADLSVGASGAIFGLLGSLAVLSVRDARQLPLGIAQSRQTWWTLVGLNTALPVIFPQIDWVAHVGGAAAGALTTLGIARRPPRPYPIRRAAWPCRAAAYACVGVTAFALLWALPRTAAEAEADWAQLWEAKLLDPTTTALAANRAAWARAISPVATEAELSEAVDGLSAALEREPKLFPGRDDVLDTLATLHYRLGQYDQALRLELDVWQRRRDSVTQWQVARFAHARLMHRTPQKRASTSPTARPAPFLAPGGPAVEVLLSRPRGDSGTVLTPGLVVWRLEQNAPHGAEVWISAERGGQLIGAIQGTHDPSDPSRTMSVELPASLNPAASDLKLSVSVVDTRPCSSPCSRPSSASRWITPDPVVADYP